MKKIYLILLVLIGMSISCTKNFEDFNTDKKRPVEVPGGYLFANAQKALGDHTATPNVNLNILKLIAQYWTETTYTDEANYDLANRAIMANQFLIYYRNVMNDLEDAKKSIAAEAAVGDIAIAEQNNRIYIIDLVEVYCYQTLVDYFGNVPYTQALDINNINPGYDDAFAIYQDLLARLNEDVAGLNDGFGSFDPADDLYFGGDVAMWKKFGNTMKVRVAINLADVDNALAKSTIEAAYAGVFAPGEICQINYPGGTNANPMYQEMIQSGRHDFVPSNTIVDIMNNLNDPRRAFYFTTVGEGEYLGGPYGEDCPFSQFSHVADAIQSETYPMVLLDYTEVAFYLAEAAERGYSVGMTAADYYNYGIGSSIVHWGGTQEDAMAYISQPSVFYTTAPGDWKQKIGTQAWLASYIRGMEGWNTWRRLDYPAFNLPPAPNSDDGQVPKRFLYPINEQTLNATSYYEAASAIGGDLMSTKLFWDKH